MNVSRVNDYLAHKQHLLAGSPGDDVLQVTRDVVALHATAATGPCFRCGREDKYGGLP